MADGTKERSLEVHDVELKVGEVHTVILEGLGSAGYCWSHRLEGSSAIVNVEGTMIGTLPDRPESGNLDEQYIISGKAPGRVRLYFELRRPWEKNTEAPLRERIFEVRVKE